MIDDETLQNWIDKISELVDTEAEKNSEKIHNQNVAFIEKSDPDKEQVGSIIAFHPEHFAYAVVHRSGIHSDGAKTSELISVDCRLCARSTAVGDLISFFRCGAVKDRAGKTWPMAIGDRTLAHAAPPPIPTPVQPVDEVDVTIKTLSTPEDNRKDDEYWALRLAEYDRRRKENIWIIVTGISVMPGAIFAFFARVRYLPDWLEFVRDATLMLGTAWVFLGAPVLIYRLWERYKHRLGC